MKRCLVYAIGLAVLALLLSGCGQSREEQRREEFSQALSRRGELRFTASLRAEYPDRSLAYTLRYTEDESGCSLRLLEPEELDGLTVRLGADGTQLKLDGLSLDAPPLDGRGLSPVSALPRLVDLLRHGHLESHWSERGQTVWELSDGEGLRAQVWLDEALKPARAELISEGRVTVFCTITDWNQG